VHVTRKPLEELAVDLLLETFGEHRFNRSAEAYRRLCALVPPLKEAHYRTNRRLKQLHDAGKLKDRALCYYKPGDLKPRYESYPTSISVETLRKGLAAAGLRVPRWRRRRTLTS
jgi:hypothetical protein